MKITLSSTALSSKLSTLSKVISSKNSIPMLGCFLFDLKGKDLTITATDGENMMRTTVVVDDADGDGRFAVSSQMINDALRELAEQPLTLTVDMESQTIEVAYMNGEYNFTVSDAAEYPEFKAVDGAATSVTLPSGTLAAMVARSLFAAATDEIRPVMSGLYFDFTPEAFVVVASDGRRLVRSRVLTVKTPSPTSFVLPRKPAGLLKYMLTDDAADVAIRFDSQTAEISTGTAMMQCRLVEGRYPNYEAVIPHDNPYSFVMDRKALLGAVKRVTPFTVTKSTVLRIHLETGKMTLNSQDLDYATRAKEDVVCDYVGNAMDIGFSGPALIEILTALDSQEVCVELADPSRPCLLTPEQQPENGDVLMLLMPMLISD